jgi:hypothetical protein
MKPPTRFFGFILIGVYNAYDKEENITHRRMNEGEEESSYDDWSASR